MGFTKLFSSLVSSTIWDEDDKTRIVWITMLALAEYDGAVMASVPGLAHQARVARKACEAALVKLSAPDFDSRTKYYDGRRIEEIEGGWRILNHTFYQNLWSREERNARQAAYMRKRRAGDAVVLHETSIPKQSETESLIESTMCPKVADVGHSNTNTYSNTNNKSKDKSTPASPVVLPDWLPSEAWDNFKAHRAANRKRHGPLTDRAERIALKALTKLRDKGYDPVEIVERTIVSGWASFFEPYESRNGNGKTADKLTRSLRAIDEA